MDKSRVCVTQASKLAKQKCVKKTNLLVYERKPDPCSPSAKNAGYIVPPIAALPAKKIRICTGADLRRMCPPKLCDCPPKKRRIGFFGVLFGLLGLGIKAGIAAALVYWTYDIGLWGDPEDTEELYLDMRDMILPSSASPREAPKKLSNRCKAEMDMMCEKPQPRDADGECLKAPSAEVAVHTVKDYWNRGVVTVFAVLTDIPGFLTRQYHKIANIGKDSKCAKKEAPPAK